MNRRTPQAPPPPKSRRAARRPAEPWEQTAEEWARSDAPNQSAHDRWRRALTDSDGDYRLLTNMARGNMRDMVPPRLANASTLTVYSAVPRGSSEIRPGDWVAIDPAYAQEHLEMRYGRRGGVVLKRVVAAGEVRWGTTSADEWFYAPRWLRGTVGNDVHERVVRAAARSGLDVPQHVLAQYGLAERKANGRGPTRGGQDLPPYAILFREAHVAGPGGWVEVARASSLAEAKDEIAAWTGPRPRQADLAQIVGPTPAERLYVFDSARSSFVAAPRFVEPMWLYGPGQPNWRPTTWLEFWEGPLAMASMMTLCTSDVHGKREAALLNAIANAVRADAPEARRDVLRTLETYARFSNDPVQAGHTSRALAVIATERDPQYGDRVRERRDRGESHADSVDAEVTLTDRRFAPIVRAHVPLAVVLASLVGADDPMLGENVFALNRGAAARRGASAKRTMRGRR